MLAGPVDVTAKTEASIRSLLRRPPSGDALARMPIEAKVDVMRVSLPLAGKLMNPPVRAAGTVALHVDLRGTAQKPHGTLAVDVAGLKTDKIPATDARVEATLDEATQLNVRIVQAGHALLALKAHAAAGLDALRDRAAWAGIPIRVRAVVGPLAMTHAGLPRPTSRTSPDPSFTASCTPTWPSTGRCARRACWPTCRRTICGWTRCPSGTRV